jgi:hypothetical protein
MLSDPSVLANARIVPFHASPHDLKNGNAHSRFGIFGIDSIPNFNGQFFADGFDPVGNPNRHWYTNTVGNPPQMGGTTVINAPIQSNQCGTRRCQRESRIRQRSSANPGRHTVRDACAELAGILERDVFEQRYLPLNLLTRSSAPSISTR